MAAGSKLKRHQTTYVPPAKAKKLKAELEEQQKKRGSRGDAVATAARRAKVSELYRQGWSQLKIAAELGVTQPMVSGDLKVLRVEWIEKSNQKFDEKKAEELARIDRLEEVSWEAWFRSCEDRVEANRKYEKVMRMVVGNIRKTGVKVPDKYSTTDDDDTPTFQMSPNKISKETKRYNRDGNPAFLERIAWCIEMRVKIMGLIRDINVTQNNFFDWNKIAEASEMNDIPDPIEARIVAIETVNTEEQQ